MEDKGDRSVNDNLGRMNSTQKGSEKKNMALHKITSSSMWMNNEVARNVEI